MDNGFVVKVSAQRDNIWWNMTQWLDAAIGPVGGEWDMLRDPEDALFSFRRESSARHFSNVWNRDPLILPYKVWEEFCQSPLGCARLRAYWRKVEWVPQAVFFCDLYGGPMTKHDTIISGRRHYRPSLKLYFFEFETDALIHWIERYGASYN